MYEMPLIAEFIFIGWMQGLMGKYIARKIERKIKRFDKRIATGKALESAREKLNG